MKMHLKLDKVFLIEVWYLSNIYKLISPGQNDHYFADDVFKCIFVNDRFLFRSVIFRIFKNY